MLRNVWFNTAVEEEHGFVELADIDPARFQQPDCNGLTALYDATYASIASANEYAKTLRDNDFGVNAVTFIITDGDDNNSAHTVADIKAELARGVQQELLESSNVILIGINAQQYRKQLEAFQRDAGLTQFVDAGDATPQNLARIANFVSKSISSQSQALGTGGASQALTF
jgi:predicted nucleic acid-binding protein